MPLARRMLVPVFVGALVAGGIGCGGGARPAGESAPASTMAAPPVAGLPEAAHEPSDHQRPRIVFLGDSLTAGLGLDADESYPALIQRRLDALGYRYEVVNAGVSGDTSAGGLRRLDWSIDARTEVLVVALGGNDALRGLAPGDLKKNLTAILERAADRGLVVLLAGMEAPPNNGRDYTDAFRGVYADLARTHQTRFIPFLLEGVAGDPSLNQADGIHPNPRGAGLVADLVWQALEPALKRSHPVTR